MHQESTTHPVKHDKEARAFVNLPGIPLEEMENLFPESDSYMEERIARLRNMKTRLGSPAESVSSGQFDDVSSVSGGVRQSRSRSSDRNTVMSPLENVVIPLPDSSELMQAKYASLDNLHLSPIPLPDVSGNYNMYNDGYFSPLSTATDNNYGSQRVNDTSAHSYFSSQHRQPSSGETTPVAGTSGFTPVTHAAEESSASTGSFGLYTKAADNVETTTVPGTGLQAGGTSDKTNSRPVIREPYTPGSYLANRDKYFGHSSREDSINKSTTSATACGIETASFTEDHATTPTPVDTYTDELGGTRTIIPTYPDVVYVIDDLPGIRATVKVKGGVIEHTFKEQDLRNKRETASDTYASSGDLTENLGHEGISKSSIGRSNHSRDSLVREVLERESKAKERSPKAQSTEEWLANNDIEQPIPVDVVLDKGRLSAIRESLSNELATGYSLKDYKNYVAKNYGRDEASRIRDRTPQRFTTYESQTMPDVSDYKPYYVSEVPDNDYTEIRRDYVGADRNYGGRRANSVSSDGANFKDPSTYAFTDLGSDWSYEHPKRSESIPSDRTYISTAYPTASNKYQSSGYSSEDNISNKEQVPIGSNSQQRRNSDGHRQQPQYKRSDSTDSQRSTSSSYKRERQANTWERESDPFFKERPSLFNRDGMMALFEDLIYNDKHDRKHDKFGLWERHSSLLRDDNFCRDFFTKDWGMSSKFDDDNFFKDFGCRRSSKTTCTEEEEMRPAGNGKGHVHRKMQSESVHTDMRDSPGKDQGKENTASSQGKPHMKQSQRSMNQCSSGKKKGNRVFDDGRFNFSSFDEAEELRESNRHERNKSDRDSKSQQQQGGGTWPDERPGAGSLFFRDFDDLIHSFKDLKAKSSKEWDTIGKVQDTAK